MRAGEKLNVVPGYAEILVDRRFLPDEDLGEVKAEIMEAVDRARKRSRATIEVDFQVIYLPHEVDTSSPTVERWCEGVRRVLGYDEDMPFIFPGTTGSTDMSFVGKVLGTRDFIGTGVMDAEHLGAHQADESVPVVNMVHLCKELVYFLVER
jgi:succinyl-diaminopimelate desuccinylase